MRYSEDHKAGTHRRIVEEASKRFRRDGIGATGLQPLMKALGLTHGGFYAHFKSKDDLVEQALRAAVESKADPSAEQPEALTALIDRYLSVEHSANPALGCPLPTMSAELGQRGQPSPTTDTFVTSRLAKMEAMLAPGHDEHQAAGMLATLVGALVLSRSVESPQLREQLLQSANIWLKKQAGDAQE